MRPRLLAHGDLSDLGAVAVWLAVIAMIIGAM